MCILRHWFELLEPVREWEGSGPPNQWGTRSVDRASSRACCTAGRTLTETRAWASAAHSTLAPRRASCALSRVARAPRPRTQTWPPPTLWPSAWVGRVTRRTEWWASILGCADSRSAAAGSAGSLLQTKQITSVQNDNYSYIIIVQ